MPCNYMRNLYLHDIIWSWKEPYDIEKSNILCYYHFKYEETEVTQHDNDTLGVNAQIA